VIAWELTIPPPARWLNANDRTDLRRQTPDRRAWRDAAGVHALAARLPHLGCAHILAVLRFGDRRKRDVHNYYPTIKAVVDGLIDYGLLPDDSSEYLIGPDLRIGLPVPPRRFGQSGELTLTITEALAGYVAGATKEDR
jgi:hypothetical protein